MRRIFIADTTLCSVENNLSFKEKIEVARQLDNLKVDYIYMPKLLLSQDALLIKTICAFVKNSCICATINNVEEIEKSYLSIKEAENFRLSIKLPISAVQMEYFFHKKPQKMLEYIVELVTASKQKTSNIEVVLEDSTRADYSFLQTVIETLIENDIKNITICDDEGVSLPDEFKLFIENLFKDIPKLNGVNLGVCCKNTNDMAICSSLLAIKGGATEVKCSSFKTQTYLDTFLKVINNVGERFDIYSNINFAELHRITRQIEWILGDRTKKPTEKIAKTTEENHNFTINDTKQAVVDSIVKLGYDLTIEDKEKVYEEFKRVASKKTVSSKDLEAIIANVSMQAPPVYKVISYVINNGNIITSSAQIKISKNQEILSGISTGDGPIDASFKTIDQILGRKFELDDFQIQAVTEGKEAVGSALVRLRNNGKIYSGSGISTDIIGASIRAYINAVNKIVYEEDER